MGQLICLSLEIVLIYMTTDAGTMDQGTEG